MSPRTHSLRAPARFVPPSPARLALAAGLLALLAAPLPSAAAAPKALPSARLAPRGAGRLPGASGLAGDAYGASLTTLGDLFGDGVSDVAVGAPYDTGAAGVTGGVVVLDGTLGGTVQKTELFGDQPLEAFGWSVAGVGDVNGDGNPDLLVGAPFFDAGASASAGRVYLYLGAPGGYQASPAWTFTTGVAGDQLGFSVAWAGDVNGDGYDDWLVGAPNHSNPESGEGEALLFLGGAGLLPSAPAWTYEPNSAGAGLGYCVATAGDVNADGYADLVVGAPGMNDGLGGEGKALLFLGHAGKPSPAPDGGWAGDQMGAAFGQAVAAAGDVNGDGYADIAVGAPYEDDPDFNEGRAQVIYGGPAPLFYQRSAPIEIGGTNSYFGTTIATAGDVNGDGYADVIVGATGVLHATNQGDAYVFLGSRGGITSFVYDQLESPTAGQVGGISVGTMGDALGGDGFSDCWMGATGALHGETVAHAGRPVSPGQSEIVAAQGYEPGYEDGYASAAADVNGDGYDDLIVGSMYATPAQPYSGAVHVYYGGPGAFPPAGAFPYPAATPDWGYTGEAGDDAGECLVNAGDVNGDGYQDFAVGAPGHANPSGGEGQALLFYGSAAGPVGAPWRLDGSAVSASFGWSIGAGGDLNGDGYDDLAVGEPGNAQGIPLEGLVSVYYGSPFGLSHTPGIVLRGGQTSALLGTGCAIVGDVNGDGYDDLVAGAPQGSAGESMEGLVYLYPGSPTGVHATPAETLQVNQSQADFGAAVYRIGDVNGDGYDDVAAAAPQWSDPESDEGLVQVYLGSPAGLVRPAAWSLESDLPSDLLGAHGIAGADVNGDGIADLVIGEPYADGGTTDGGRVRVYRGSPGGLALTADLDEAGGFYSGRLGFSTGGAADFDGDGFPDLWYASPGLALAQPYEGGVYVRFGNSALQGARGAARPLDAWRSDGGAPISPGQRADATTAFRLRGRGRSAAGRTRLRLEAEAKPFGVPFGTSGHALGAWQPTGPVVGGQGSAAPVDFAFAGLSAATRYRWRARTLTRSLFFPDTPWQSTAQRNASQRHVTTAGAPGVTAVPPAAGPGARVALAPAAPNPSRTPTALAFELAKAGPARLSLYDLRGRLVRTLFDGLAEAGRTVVGWDGRDGAGRRAAAGAYFVRLSALGEERVGKLVRLE